MWYAYIKIVSTIEHENLVNGVAVHRFQTLSSTLHEKPKKLLINRWIPINHGEHTKKQIKESSPVNNRIKLEFI